MRWSLIFLAVLLASCASQRVTYVPVVKDSIQVRTELRVDSVWRDRVRVEYVKGDTVRILDSVIVERFKWRAKADTVIVRDSIPVIRDVPGPVEYRRTSYDTFCVRGFWVFVLLLVLRVGWWAARKYIKLQTGI